MQNLPGGGESLSRKKLASQFAWISIGRLLGALIQAVTILLVARDLGPHSFGVFSAVFGVAIVFQAGFDLGIATMVVRERAVTPTSPIIYSALTLTDRLALAITLITGLPLLFLAIIIDPFFYYLLPLAIWAACERHADTWLAIPLADGDARINTQNLVTRRVGTVLLYLGAVFAGVNAALAFSASMAITATVSLIVIRRIVIHRIDTSRSRVTYREVINRSWPYWLNSVGTQARNLDTLVVSAVAGPSQAGFYAATSRATGPLRILSTSLAAVLLPASADRNRKIGSLLGIVGFTALFCCLLYGSLILAVPAAVEMFLGAVYEGAVLPLQIVLGGLVFAAIASLFTSMLQGLGYQLFVAKTAIANTAICLLAVSIGGLVGEAVGAAWALSASFASQAALLGYKVALHTRSMQNGPVPVLLESTE